VRNNLAVAANELKAIVRAPDLDDPQSFDSFVASYERRDELSGGWVTDWLIEQLLGRSGSCAIDLGCGNGRSASLLADHYDTVRAVDLSPEMIQLARSRRPHPRVSYAVADLDHESGEYDLVLSIMVLHHVPDIRKTLDRVSRMVSPGGTAILVDNAQMPQTRWRFHFNHIISLALDLRFRKSNAFERFLLKSDRRWMDHLASDRFLTPSEFDAVYREALPGVSITKVGFLYAAVWDRPRS
jgi:ubiquinone/menaquinone biosynthesis C-methylase UbiE